MSKQAENGASAIVSDAADGLSKNARKRKLRAQTTLTANGPAGIKQFSNKWMMKVYAEKPPFPEELFKSTFSKARLETLVAALKMATEKEVNESSRLLEEDYTYSVMISSHKVPHVPVHLSRIALKHSLQNDESEIALFVKDLKRGRRLDFEPTIQHYENLLREKNIKNRITIIPINQLYNEYATFELRRKLPYLYDKFLVDSSVAAHVNGFLGSKMLKKGRLAYPINLSKDNLHDEIEKALCKVFYKHINRGITQSVQVGKHSMSNEHIAENIIDLLHQFGDIHPGGYKNVHKLFLRPQANVSVAIPIYVSLRKPIEGTPINPSIKEEFVQEQSAKAAEILEKFDINAAGKLVQKRHPAGFIINDELLLSEDEEDGPEPPKRGRIGKVAPNGVNPEVPVVEKKVEKAQPTPVQKTNIPKRNDNVNRTTNANDNNLPKRKKAPQTNRPANNNNRLTAAKNQSRALPPMRLMDNLDLLPSLSDSLMRNNRNNDFDYDNRSMGNNRNFGNEDFTRRPNNSNKLGGGLDLSDNYNRGFGFGSGGNFGNNDLPKYGGNGGGNNNSRLFNNRF